MLHLAIIGIACAASALNESIAFIERKNNEFNTFCLSDEGKENIAKVFFPQVSPNVDVRNSSDCGGQKITNRTSSYFYDYIINRYQSTRNNSCVLTKNVSLKKLRSFQSNVDVKFRKRALLWEKKKSTSSTSQKNAEYPIRSFRKKRYKVISKRSKMRKLKGEALNNKMEFGGLSAKEKKLFLKLKNLKTSFSRYYLKDNGLDLEKKLQKFFKNMESEYQLRKSKSLQTPTTISENHKKTHQKNSKNSISFFNNNLKHIFSLKKNSFRNKHRNIDTNSDLLSVNIVRHKNPVFGKASFIGTYDSLKTNSETLKNSKLKKNRRHLCNDFRDLKSMYRKKLIAKPYPYSNNFKSKINFLYPNHKFIFERKKNRNFRTISPLFKSQLELKNWPNFKELPQHHSNIYKPRRKRHEKLNDTESDPPSTNPDPEISQNADKSLNCDSNFANEDGIAKKKLNILKREEKLNVSLNASGEVKEGVTEAVSVLNATLKYEGDYPPDHTIEKPFLERDFQNQIHETNFKMQCDCNPIFNSTHHQSYRTHSFQSNADHLLLLSNSTKVPHRLRKCLTRHLLKNRKKRGMKCCSPPRKCWRSAPLLCIPYIKKGQEDILKYLIQVMEKLLGKPIPPKKDIFEKTKYKPEKGPTTENINDDAYEDDYETETMEMCYGSNNKPTLRSRICTTVKPSQSPTHRSNNCKTNETSQQNESSNSGGAYCTSQITTAHPQTEPQSPRKGSACLQDCSCTPPSVFSNTFKTNYATPLQLTLTPSANVTTPTKVSLLIPVSEEGVTQNLNQFSNQPLLGPSSVTETPAPMNSFCSSALIAPSNQVTGPSFTNTDNTKSSSAFTTTSTTARITESSTFTTTQEMPLASAIELNPFVKNSPKTENYFSFTPYSFTDEPDYSKMEPYQYSEILTPALLNQIKIQNPCEKKSKQIDCDSIYKNLGNIPSIFHHTQPWESVTKSIPVSFDDEIFRYPFKYDTFEIDKSYNRNLGKYMKKKKGFNSDYFFDENLLHYQPMNFYVPPKKLFKKHQKKFLKQNLHAPTRLSNSPDYYSNEQYLLPRSDRINKVNSKKHPKRKRKNRFRKDKYRKVKHLKKQNSLARQKREDDYIWPEINRDYLDESDKDIKENLSEISDKNSSNQSWTPPIFDMFNELAKAVSVLTITESETIKAESGTARNTAAAIIITTSPPTSAPTKSTILNTMGSSIITAKTTSALISPKRAANNVISTACPTTSNFSVTTNLPVTVAATTSNNGVAAVVNTKNTGLFKSKNFAEASVNKNMAFQNEKIQNENENHSAKYTNNNLSLLSAENKSISPAVFSSHAFKIGVESIIGSKYTKKLIGAKGANSKANLTESESFMEKTLKADSRKKEKNGKGNVDLDVGDGQVPTTLKMAVIVKGPKKMLTKPSPKVFSKVYPDSFDSEVEANETIATTAVTSVKPSIENKTTLLTSTPKPDNRLQILAVCEGYLEIIKRLKALNQSLGENFDAELTQYCENIISQSFNTQIEKPKKIEPSEPLVNSSNLISTEDSDNNTKVTHKVDLSVDDNESDKNFTDSQKNKTDDTDVEDYDSDEKNKSGKVKKKHKKLKKEKNLTDTDTSENTKTKAKKKKRKKQNHSSRSHVKKEKEEKNHGAEVGILKRGISEEQEKLIELLKKRKRALVSWLMNSNDLYKKEDLPETNYLNEEDFIPPEYNYSEYSGTIKPKRDENNSKTTTHSLYNVSEGIYPIYAKRYGYNSGGELREMEILWRKINEKTHEKKILKNISVVAYLIMSTKSPSHDEVKLQDSKEYESEYMPDPELKVGNKAVLGSEISDSKDKSSSSETEKYDASMPLPRTSASTAKPKNNKSAVLPIRNDTHTFISKPELSAIVGAPSSENKIHQNTTRKASSHKFGVAKDFVQEYSIEFLNYAVYILPAMFTILFFFCSFGCALYILKSRKSFKRVKKRKVRALSSDETMETTEESEDRRAKRKRENKRKKKDTALAENLEKKTRKKFWNVLKMPSNSCKEFNEGIRQSERKSFLKFLKGRKDENKAECKKFFKKYQGSGDEGVYNSDQSASKKEMHKGDASSETVERRELISLLEELKKIELEQTGEKKEVKSVQVQYTIQEDKNPFCQRPEFSYPYEKNVFGLPKGYFFSSKKFPNQQTDSAIVKDWDLYEDVSEMTELLPCECSYLSKKNDYFRHFRLNQENECKNIYKIYRDSGVNPNKPFRDKNLMVNQSEKQSLICNKFRSVNSDTSDEFMGVNKKSVGTEVRLTDNTSPFRLLFKKNTNSVEEMKDMKHPQSKKKYVRLKDDGVLCKL